MLPLLTNKYLGTAIVIGFILFVTDYAGLSLGKLGQILYIIAIVLVLVWALQLFGVL